MKNLFFFIAVFLLYNKQIKAQQAINQVDSKGLKQGQWIKVNPQNNKVIYKGQFKDNKPYGIFKYYFSEIDTIKTIMEFRNNGKFAYAKIYQLNGKIQATGKYIEEKRDSIWNFYNENGKLISFENYKNGLKEGKLVMYYPNGAVLEEGNYKNDKKHGAFKEFYDTKQLKSEANFIEGKPVGKNAFYYPNGMLANIGYYNENGNKFGVWLTKDKEGKVTEKEVYDNGKLLEGKQAEEWLEKNKTKKEN